MQRLLGATISAAARTFKTTELLEQILKSLSIEDVVQAQRVNHKWRDVIAGSLELQQTLFLAAAPCHAYLYFRYDAPHDTRRLVFTPELLEDYHCLTIAQHHPAFGYEEWEQYASHLRICVAYSKIVGWGSDIWENMFITQPPCERVHVAFSGRSWDDDFDVYDARGISVGTIRRRVMEEVAKRQEQTPPLERWRGVDGSVRDVELTVFNYISESSRFVTQAMLGGAEGCSDGCSGIEKPGTDESSSSEQPDGDESSGSEQPTETT